MAPAGKGTLLNLFMLLLLLSLLLILLIFYTDREQANGQGESREAVRLFIFLLAYLYLSISARTHAHTHTNAHTTTTTTTNTHTHQLSPPILQIVLHQVTSVLSKPILVKYNRNSFVLISPYSLTSHTSFCLKNSSSYTKKMNLSAASRKRATDIFVLHVILLSQITV